MVWLDHGLESKENASQREEAGFQGIAGLSPSLDLRTDDVSFLGRLGRAPSLQAVLRRLEKESPWRSLAVLSRG